MPRTLYDIEDDLPSGWEIQGKGVARGDIYVEWDQRLGLRILGDTERIRGKGPSNLVIPASLMEAGNWLRQSHNALECALEPGQKVPKGAKVTPNWHFIGVNICIDYRQERLRRWSERLQAKLDKLGIPYSTSNSAPLRED